MARLASWRYAISPGRAGLPARDALDALAWRPNVELPPRELVLEHPRVDPAKRLYVRLGYVDLAPDDENGRMLIELK